MNANETITTIIISVFLYILYKGIDEIFEYIKKNFCVLYIISYNSSFPAKCGFYTIDCKAAFPVI